AAPVGLRTAVLSAGACGVGYTPRAAAARGSTALVRRAVAVVVHPVTADLGARPDGAVTAAPTAVDTGHDSGLARTESLATRLGLASGATAALIDLPVAVVVHAVADLELRTDAADAVAPLPADACLRPRCADPLGDPTGRRVSGRATAALVRGTVAVVVD